MKKVKSKARVYNVSITEKLQTTQEIIATSKQKAIEKAKQRYRNADIVPDNVYDFKSADFEVV